MPSKRAHQRTHGITKDTKRQAKTKREHRAVSIKQYVIKQFSISKYFIK